MERRRPELRYFRQIVSMFVVRPYERAFTDMREALSHLSDNQNAVTLELLKFEAEHRRRMERFRELVRSTDAAETPCACGEAECRDCGPTPGEQRFYRSGVVPGDV